MSNFDDHHLYQNEGSDAMMPDVGHAEQVEDVSEETTKQKDQQRPFAEEEEEEEEGGDPEDDEEDEEDEEEEEELTGRKGKKRAKVRYYTCLIDQRQTFVVSIATNVPLLAVSLISKPKLVMKTRKKRKMKIMEQVRQCYLCPRYFAFSFWHYRWIHRDC
jgi:hypothetical protein